MENTEARRLTGADVAPRTPVALLEQVFGEPADGTDAVALVGHERAAQAIDYALSVGLPGYNLFVMGHKGVGNHASCARLWRAMPDR